MGTQAFCLIILVNSFKNTLILAGYSGNGVSILMWPALLLLHGLSTQCQTMKNSLSRNSDVSTLWAVWPWELKCSAFPPDNSMLSGPTVSSLGDWLYLLSAGVHRVNRSGLGKPPTLKSSPSRQGVGRAWRQSYFDPVETAPAHVTQLSVMERMRRLVLGEPGQWRPPSTLPQEISIPSVEFQLLTEGVEVGEGYHVLNSTGL